jgi:hypothetical protein
MTPRILIGIDPGKDTGYAVVENGELTNLYSRNFWWVVECIRNGLYLKDDVCVYIEHPGLSSPTWGREKYIRDIWAAVRKNGAGLASLVARRDKQSQNVGKVVREAELLCELMDSLGIAYTAVKPTNQQKWTHDYFLRVFPEWKGRGRTNEHMRDAARLVAGR